MWYAFLCLLHFYLHHCCLLNSYMFSLLIQEIISWFVRIIHLSLVQLFIQFFFLVMACLILCGAKTFFKIFCSIFANIICFYKDNERVYIRITKFYIFTMFWFYIIIPYLDIILINLNKQSYSLIFEFFSFLLLINFLWKFF